MSELQEVENLLHSWICKRRITIQQYRNLADELQEQEKRSRSVKVVGTTASVVGGYVAVVTGLSAICTGGATLTVAGAAGSAFASAGGLVVAGNELVDNILKSKAAKLLDKAIVNDKKTFRTFWEALQLLQAKINGVEGTKIKYAISVGGLSYNCYNLVKSVADETAVVNSTFRALGKGWKAVHVASVGLSSICLVLNAKTLGETLGKVCKGEIPKVVCNLRSEAQKLEDEIPVYKEKVRTLKRRNEPIAPSVRRNEPMLFGIFICFIGIVTYFVYHYLLTV